jgi:hypothetical protein
MPIPHPVMKGEINPFTDIRGISCNHLKTCMTMFHIRSRVDLCHSHQSKVPFIGCVVFDMAVSSCTYHISMITIFVGSSSTTACSFKGERIVSLEVL